MKTLKEVIDEYPPRYASSINEQGYLCFFMLEDGQLFGGVKHSRILGSDRTDEQQAFCVQNNVLRVVFNRGINDEDVVCCEVFQNVPNDAQFEALATLYLKNRTNTKLIWDVYSNRRRNWSRGEGTMVDFKRALEKQ